MKTVIFIYLFNFLGQTFFRVCDLNFKIHTCNTIAAETPIMAITTRLMKGDGTHEFEVFVGFEGEFAVSSITRLMREWGQKCCSCYTILYELKPSMSYAPGQWGQGPAWGFKL